MMEGIVVLGICVLLLGSVMLVIATMSRRMSSLTVVDPASPGADRPPSGLSSRELVEHLNRRGVSMLTIDEARRVLVDKIVVDMRTRHRGSAEGIDDRHLAALLDDAICELGTDTIFRGVSFAVRPGSGGEARSRLRRPSVI